MAYYEDLSKHSQEVDASFEGKQYRFVKKSSTDQRVTLCGDGQQAFGVIQDDPRAAGAAGCIGVAGITKIELGGTVAAGDKVASDANGKGVAAISGDWVNGVCIIGGASGEYGSISLTVQGEGRL